MKSYFYYILLLVVLVSCTQPSHQSLELPVIFSDDMVLQQQAAVTFLGTATPKATVEITPSWNDEKIEVVADATGTFQTKVNTPAYGGPYQIRITQDGETKVLKNVLVGDVWLCSGQSNMEMPLEGWGKVKNYKEEIAKANYDEIRLFQVVHEFSDKAKDTLINQSSSWQLCNSENIAEFSSTAYFFGREVYKETGVPIGLLHSSWGGTVIEAWMSENALKTVDEFKSYVDVFNADEEGVKKFKNNEQAKIAKWTEDLVAVDKGYARNSKDKEHTWGALETFPRKVQMKLPCYWETEHLPSFDGVVWFQKDIDLKEADVKADYTLQFFADDDDEVWVNSSYVGSSKGYSVASTYKIPASMLKAGKNTITIRVFDETGGGGIYGKPADFKLFTKEKQISLAGDWYYAVGTSLADAPKTPYVPKNQNRPTVLYKAMINPLKPLSFKGVIWYQGESNSERAAQYRRLFPKLISDWRTTFQQPDLPFYFVQLASYMERKEQPEPSSWAELREAQLQTLKVPNTGMAVAIDIGEAADIHPKNKQDVGKRLANIALAKTYQKDVAFSGPLFKDFEIKDNSIVLHFDFADGMYFKNDKATAFQIAGEDQQFYWANATIDGESIVVTSPKVKRPVAVRYAWANNPEASLYNSADLPASPFRTDDWEGVTLDGLE